MHLTGYKCYLLPGNVKRKEKSSITPAFSSDNGDYTAEQQFQTAKDQRRKGIRQAGAWLGLWEI